MFNILNELKEMIKMEGGDPTGIRDIAIAVKTLKTLKLARQNRREDNHRHFEDRRKERPAETEE